MTMHDELRAKINEWLGEAKLLDYNGLQEESRTIDQCARQLDAILAKYADHVTIPQKPEDRRLDHLCFLPEAGLPTREVARVIYQVVAQE